LITKDYLDSNHRKSLTIIGNQLQSVAINA